MRIAVFLALWLGSCLFALWRGGAPERLTALTFLGGLLLSIVAANAFTTPYRGLEPGILAVDLLMLVCLTVIALRAHRLWPIPIAALQLLQVTGHILKLGDPQMFPLLYWFTTAVWAYPMLLILDLGTVLLIRRVSRRGRQPGWSWATPIPQ